MGALLWYAQGLPPNNRLGWKRQEVPNTPTYYDTATITAVKRFIAQAPGVFVPGKLQHESLAFGSKSRGLYYKILQVREVQIQH
jgi:hypothetical protein